MEKLYKEMNITDFILKRRVEVVMLFVGLLLGAWFDWTTVEILIFLVFLWSLLGPLPSRWLAGPALFFLALVPILLAFDKEDRAEEFAVYAYYFLVMAVIRGIVEVRGEEDSK